MISIDEARSLYQGAESGHDFDHILRVLGTAERLAEAEGADREVVRAAALLHDMARGDEDAPAETIEPVVELDHAEMAARRAHALLLRKGATPEFAGQVAKAIAAHRFRSNRRPETLEGKILFDADKLDAIGAIGVARAFAIAGRANERLYSEPAADVVATRNQRNSDHTPVVEFAVKLSKIHGQLYTETARKWGLARHAFMVEFFRQLRAEMEGKS